MSDDINDFDLQALLDNELNEQEQNYVREHIAQNTRAQRRYEELKQQKATLLQWWQSHKGDS